MQPTVEPPVFEYAMEQLPPGRLGPRRWRWELWERDRLLAAGWHPVARRAHLALRAAATRRAHERLDLVPLRPERLAGSILPAPGATVRVGAGPVACVLAPRGAQSDGRTGAAAA